MIAPLLERALAIYEKIQGVDHGDVAIALNNLAASIVSRATTSARNRVRTRPGRPVLVHIRLPYGASSPRPSPVMPRLFIVLSASVDLEWLRAGAGNRASICEERRDSDAQRVSTPRLTR